MSRGLGKVLIDHGLEKFLLMYWNRVMLTQPDQESCSEVGEAITLRLVNPWKSPAAKGEGWQDEGIFFLCITTLVVRGIGHEI